MTDTSKHPLHAKLAEATIPAELRDQVIAQRERLGITKKGLADRAGKVREVIYRIENGKDVTVSSLVDVLRVLGLKLAIVDAGIPSMEEVADAFADDDDDDV